MHRLLPIWFLFLPGAFQAQPQSESLRVRIEQLHESPGEAIRGEQLIRGEAVAHFFEARNFAPAWPGSGPDQIVQAIRDIEQDGLAPGDYHLAALEQLRAAPAATPGRDVDLQILLTDAVAALADHVRFGRIRPVTLDRRWNVDPRAGWRPSRQSSPRSPPRRPQRRPWKS